MSVGLMINERELINDRMIHSKAHCPSKFSGGSRLLSVVPVRIVAAPPRKMKRSKIFRGRKKKRRKKEKGKKARPAGTMTIPLHDLGNGG